MVKMRIGAVSGEVGVHNTNGEGQAGMNDSVAILTVKYSYNDVI